MINKGNFMLIHIKVGIGAYTLSVLSNLLTKLLYLIMKEILFLLLLVIPFSICDPCGGL